MISNSSIYLNPGHNVNPSLNHLAFIALGWQLWKKMKGKTVNQSK